MDFTLAKYKELLSALKDAGYKAQTFAEFLSRPSMGKTAILRHDVDKKPLNSLRIAEIESEAGVKATYYFRTGSCSWNEEIVKEIARLGHEIGYHYENMDRCCGDAEKAYADFCKDLQMMRSVAEVSTACMHGSPRSRHDNRSLWKTHSYKDLGIIGEPYLDTDFSKVLYLSDTGRRWDGYKVSVRDKVEKFQEEWRSKGWVYHSTDDIIKALSHGTLPEGLMITTHPQRWNPFGMKYVEEMLVQKAKNAVKYIMIKGKH